VVGVILDLGLMLGWHLIFPRATAATPFAGGFEWFHALLSAAAFVALSRYRQDILRVIAACAGIGVVRAYLD
jgi:chromate transporter